MSKVEIKVHTAEFLHDKVEEGIRSMFLLLGINPDDEAVRDTPTRWIRAIREMTEGYHDDPAHYLERQFNVARADELIVVKDMPFVSLCEHHILPFTGVAHVGYLPSDHVVGLSKIARVMHVYSKRLQTQERMTYQIAEAMLTVSKSVGVVVEANHECMACRGVKTPGTMVTSALLGPMREDHALREEFLRLVGAR